MLKKNIDKNNIGNAGEYYIASRLSAENFIATITLGRAEKYDIIAVSPNKEKRTVKLSVKTSYSSVNSFPLGEKDEHGADKDFYYVFVRLNEFKSNPDFWVVPSFYVNEVTSKSHKMYLAGVGKNGQKRKDNGLRKFWLTNDNVDGKAYPKDWLEILKKCYLNINQLK